MGEYLGTEPGEMEIIEYYSDNMPVFREVRFSIPAENWSEFEASQGYREIAAYVKALQIQRKTSWHPAPEWTLETGAYAGNSTNLGGSESFWDRVRRKSHRERMR